MAALQSGRKTVSDILMPVRLSDSSMTVSRVDVMALTDNIGTVRIGGPNVNSISGRECGAPLTFDDVFTLSDVDLHECWVAAHTAGDGFTWVAVV